MSEEQGRGCLVAVIIGLEALGSVLRLCKNTLQLDLDFCFSPFFKIIYISYVNYIHFIYIN